MKRTLLITLATAFGLATAAPALAAAKIPCKTAKLIVPWKAGGGTHVIFSIFEKTIQELDVTPKIQVVTMPGQSGNKGAKEAAKSKPDGCTLFAIHQSAVLNFLSGRMKFHFDGFDTVANLTSTPDMIGAAADAPFKSFAKFAEYAKANPGKIKVGASFGSTSQFIFLFLADKMGIDLSYVPYDGTRERMTALLSGAIDMGVLNIASGGKYLKGGELQGLAIADEKRAKQLPDVPTLKESGVDLVFTLNRGIVVPKGTPRDVIDHWSAIFKKATENPGLLAQMDAKGTGVKYQNPDEYRTWADGLYDDFEAVAIKVGLYKK